MNTWGETFCQKLLARSPLLAVKLRVQETVMRGAWRKLSSAQSQTDFVSSGSLRLWSSCRSAARCRTPMICFARTTPRKTQRQLQRRFMRGRCATWKASSLCQSGCHWLTLLGRRLASTTCSPTAPALAWRLGPRRRWTSPWGASRKSLLFVQIKRDFFSPRASGCSPNGHQRAKRNRWRAAIPGAQVG